LNGDPQETVNEPVDDLRLTSYKPATMPGDTRPLQV